MTAPVFRAGSSVAAVLAAASLAAQESPTGWKIEAADHQTVEARIGYSVQAGTYVVTRWTAVVPEPPELPGQTGVKVSATPKSTVVAEPGPLARKLRVFDVPVAAPAPGAKLVLDVTVRATLRSRRLVALAAGEAAPKVAPLSAAEARVYTTPGPSTDFEKPAFQAWLDRKELRQKPGESPVGLAERVLGVLRADFNYSFSRSGKPASEACLEPTSDGGGLTLLFVGAMRANKVPARSLAGRLARPRKAGARPAEFEYDWPHVRGEFYLAGVGWVPVHPGSVPITTVPIRELIGNDPGDFLALHADADLRLPLGGRVRTAQFLNLGPVLSVAGRGTYDGTPGPTVWEVTTTPVAKN